MAVEPRYNQFIARDLIESAYVAPAGKPEVSIADAKVFTDIYRVDAEGELTDMGPMVMLIDHLSLKAEAVKASDAAAKAGREVEAAKRKLRWACYGLLFCAPFVAFFMCWVGVRILSR